MGQLLLVVDESRTVCRAVKLVFHASVYDVVTAASASEALGIARARRPAAVIVAYHLPDASGFDLVRQLRAHDETREVPALVLTGRFHAYDPAEIAACGAQGSIDKPFKTDDLIAALGQALARPMHRPVQYTPGVNTVAAQAHEEPAMTLADHVAPAAAEATGRWSRPEAIPLPAASPYVDPSDAIEHGPPRFEGYGAPAPAAAAAPVAVQPAPIVTTSPLSAELDPLPEPEPLALPEPPPPRAALVPPAPPQTTSGPLRVTHTGDAQGDVGAFRKIRPAGPPPPPAAATRRVLAPPPPDDVRETGPRPAVPVPAPSAQPAVAPAPITAPTTPVAVPVAAAAPAPAPTPETSTPGVRASGQHVATPAESFDPAHLRVLVREAVAPLVREALPGIVKEYLASMLRQTGQKLDEYSRQRIDAFVANDLPRIASDALQKATADVPAMAQAAIDRQLAALTGDDL